MKRLIVAMILLPAALLAQSGSSDAPSQLSAPDYSQLYCSGFITRDAISRSSFVLGSKESPHEDRFAQRSVLFLRGPELAQGARYSLLRQVTDPNRVDSSPEQRKRLASLGGMYEDIGWVTVQSVVNGTAVASFDFACSPALPGDIVVPFQERPAIAFRSQQPALDTFRAPSSAIKGHILGSRDYLGLLGGGVIVYTDFGSTKGAKPGDYLMISRGYAPGDLNKVDRASEYLPRGTELSAVNPAAIPPDSDSLMPTHMLGEMVVLNVSPDSSTALITRTAAEVELGDVVQAENPDGNDSASVSEAPPADPSAGQNDSRLRRAWSFVRDKAETVK